MRANNIKKTGRIFISMAIMLGILGIANPYLFIGVPILTYIGVGKIRKSKSVEFKMKERAFYLYEASKYGDSLKIIQQLEEMNKSDKECVILKVRNEYNIGNYEECIELLKQVPESKINMDLDLLLKKSDSLFQLKYYKEALDVYKAILKISPKSNYVISRCTECELRVEN